jgi:Tol biopolymer transport system component
MIEAQMAVVRQGSRAQLVAVIVAVTFAALTLAANAAAAVLAPCPNEQLRAENSSTQLPDCRAYEQVTPAGPYDTVFNAVSPDGDTVFFASSGAIAGLPPEANNARTYVRMFGVSRSGEGWGLSSLTDFTAQLFHNYPFVGSSADGSRMFVTSTTVESGENTPQEALALNLYETVNGGPPLLVSHDSTGNPLRGNKHTGLMGPVVVSSDGTHLVFSSGSPLTAVAAASGGGPYVYEADSAGNVSLVSVMSGGELPSPSAGAALGSATAGEQIANGVVANAVSTDGSTVFFNSSEQYDLSAPAGTGTQVFMHRGGSTLDVSNGTENASFDEASSSGSNVVFSDGSKNLWEFDSTTHTLIPVSSGAGGLNEFLTMSADGSHVYFVSDLQLDPSGPPAGGKFLYEWANGQVTYIATLSEIDRERLTAPPSGPTFETRTIPREGEVPGGEGQGDRTGTDALGPIRATADGAHLVFESERPLTPDDHNQEVGRLNVYEYTDGKGLARVSQGSLPGSGNGPYEATIGSWQQGVEFDPGTTEEGHPFTFGVGQTDGRALAEDGSVFFSSREALADGGTNGPLHVYEWKEGHTYLISPAGAEATDAQYLENGADGANVYFSTTQAVLPSDTNGGWVNVWDARVDGGFHGPPRANPCAENECPVSLPVATGTPPSMTFGGPGNPTAGVSPPTTQSNAVAKPKPLTRTQILLKALKSCRARQHNKHKRVVCESRAKKQYRAKSTATKRGRDADRKRK